MSDRYALDKNGQVYDRETNLLLDEIACQDRLNELNEFSKSAIEAVAAVCYGLDLTALVTLYRQGLEGRDLFHKVEEMQDEMRVRSELHDG